jgi:hypothetical protein
VSHEAFVQSTVVDGATEGLNVGFVVLLLWTRMLLRELRAAS